MLAGHLQECGATGSASRLPDRGATESAVRWPDPGVGHRISIVVPTPWSHRICNSVATSWSQRAVILVVSVLRHPLGGHIATSHARMISLIALAHRNPRDGEMCRRLRRQVVASSVCNGTAFLFIRTANSPTNIPQRANRLDAPTSKSRPRQWNQPSLTLVN